MRVLLLLINLVTNKTKNRNRWEDTDYHRRKYRSLGKAELVALTTIKGKFTLSKAAVKKNSYLTKSRFGT